MAKSQLPLGPRLGDLSPMLLAEKRKPFSSSDFTYELKFDGYRMLAESNWGRVKLRTRQGTDATAWFPELADGLQELEDGRHILDAEVCVLDKDTGISDFNRLQERAIRRRWYKGCEPVTLCAFDLLVQDGRSLMGLPLVERKARLQLLLSPAVPFVLYVGDVPDDGEGLYRQAVALELEGIVAKRKDSIYLPGERAPQWFKIKRPGAVPPGRFKR